MQIIPKVRTRFERLTAIKFVRKSNDNRDIWLFSCTCGKEKEIRIKDVLDGKTKSCGCLQKEIIGNLRTTHGMAGTPFYNIWKGIRRRCNYKNNPDYKYYGGRGIRVCAEWEVFENFKNDMYSYYKKGLQIERINNNGDYCKENCKWISHKEQMRNTRKTLFITIKGITKTLPEWVEETGKKYSTVYNRIYTYGWDLDKALNYPLKTKTI